MVSQGSITHRPLSSAQPMASISVTNLHATTHIVVGGQDTGVMVITCLITDNTCAWSTPAGLAASIVVDVVIL